ncbi:hypothetical protein PHYSODRAFT_294915 [Phytophthora sojae]|uniref:Uncharacterized protein n=1 Tax=Phytophthora sojae (strain P6497) TaxID=1094619 RepID=G4YL62_PHYSP|nr:hypothetical protein PHYSODRAFT_294915 [Phytophthora sojae]EGZ29977.1 hypothetical protein PHYSODRAFT_294915 [Phytophthora sojae]|eukprot:XP_009517252.1 hypothetical protein PHYSODRAFT_294915 [Phytophthora sojae]
MRGHVQYRAVLQTFRVAKVVQQQPHRPPPCFHGSHQPVSASPSRAACPELAAAGRLPSASGRRAAHQPRAPPRAVPAAASPATCWLVIAALIGCRKYSATTYSAHKNTGSTTQASSGILELTVRDAGLLRCTGETVLAIDGELARRKRMVISLLC